MYHSSIKADQSAWRETIWEINITHNFFRPYFALLTRLLHIYSVFKTHILLEILIQLLLQLHIFADVQRYYILKCLLTDLFSNSVIFVLRTRGRTRGQQLTHLYNCFLEYGYPGVFLNLYSAFRASFVSKRVQLDN